MSGNQSSSSGDRSTSPSESPPQVDLSKPRYDQSTYQGRAQHFFETANVLNAFVSSKRLEEAAKLVKDYKSGHAPPATTEEQLWEAKRLYDAAYHPDTGEKMFFAGRMSFQVPGNMIITGCMQAFHKNFLPVVFWQTANQAFNSVVNYTNRSGNEVMTPWSREVMVPFLAATGAATSTALTLNRVVAKRVSPLLGRLIPFAAVVAANCINIPVMRSRELQFGVPVYDQEENLLGMSKAAATKGIGAVVVSRVLMATPVMVIPPIIMNTLENRGILKKMSSLGPKDFTWKLKHVSLQVALVGLCFVFATPLCCAIFPQKSSISVSWLDKEVQDSLKKTHPDIQTVYFNKGL